MAMTAQRTKDMQIGTMLSVAGMRSAPVTASAMSAANKVAPGRTFFGTETGYTDRLTCGLPPVPVARTRTYLENVRDLMAGREVNYLDGSREVLVRQVSAELLDNLAHPVSR